MLVKAMAVSTLAFLAWIVPATAAAPPKPTLILAFGDSLTAGYELAGADSFPAQLEKRLKAGGLPVRVHNAGVSGDTTTGGKGRLAWVLAALKQKPDLVILALGANDALRGVDPRTTRANLDAMIADLNRRGIPVLLAGMLAPPNMGGAYAKSFNEIFPALARKHGTSFYPFLLDGVAARPRLLLADGMHPNSQGTAVMAQRVAPLVRQALKR